MKIGFYSPYLDSLSGGERYVLALASHWSKSHDVRLFWDEKSIVSKASRHLHIGLSHVHTVENVFRTRNIFKKMMVSRGYDLIFFLSDGSVPTTFAKYNILHFQVPFQRVHVHSIKLGRYQAVVCNSDFTKRNIDSTVGAHSKVIYPPVEEIRREKGAKKNIILSVGRFHPLKKQDVLIEAFRKARFNDYELVLVGGLLPADELYFKRLKLAVKGLSARLIPNISFEKLAHLYNQSSIYWHAAGYREVSPEHMEHFGITTVEAMSVGSVPVVYNGGGLPEIVREGEDGFLWANTDDLLTQTSRIIASETLRQSLSKKSVIRSRQFSKERFTASFDTLLASITK